MSMSNEQLEEQAQRRLDFMREVQIICDEVTQRVRRERIERFKKQEAEDELLPEISLEEVLMKNIGDS